jgi:hypothetical protein
MALYHMVWIKFHDHLSEARKQEHLQNIRALQDKVPSVRHIGAGHNVTNRAPEGYDHGIVVTFDDQAGLEAYDEHPEHKAVAEPLDAEADILAMDIVEPA